MHVHLEPLRELYVQLQFELLCWSESDDHYRKYGQKGTLVSGYFLGNKRLLRTGVWSVRLYTTSYFSFKQA